MTGVLDEILKLLALATPAPLTAEDRNFVLYPVVVPATIQQGVLAHTEGGLTTDNQLSPRVSAILGPGATFQGIADRLLALYATAASAGGSATPTRDELARALVVYNQRYLPAATWAEHLVGLHLPLPVEITAAGVWTVNADSVRTWAGSFSGSWLARLTTPADALDVVDPLDLHAQINALITSMSDHDALAAELAMRALRNPFGSVFEIYEAMRQLASNAFDVALKMLGGMVDHQVALLAGLSAGNGILRRLASILASPPAGLSTDQAALTRADGLLTGALWQTVGGTQTRVAFSELPETSNQKKSRGALHNVMDAATDPTGGLHRLVLGRDVAVGVIASNTINGTKFTGPDYVGRVSPGPLTTRDRANVNPSSDAKLSARLAVATAIFLNEGAMDSAVMCDRARLSTGFQQWSANAANEWPALLASFKATAPDDFDLFFAMNGLDVQPLASPPGSFQLCKLDATDTATSMTTAQLTSFLGGTTSPDGLTVTFATDWAARARIVALVSEAYRRCQLQMAAGRFDRLAADAGSLQIGAQHPAVTQLMTSKLGAALLLDTHINKPAHVHSVLQTLANLPGLPAADSGRDQALTTRFHDHRSVNDRPHRNHVIDLLGLDAAHGSFAGW